MAVGENITNVHFPLKKTRVFCLLKNPPHQSCSNIKIVFRKKEKKKNLLGCKLQGSFLTQYLLQKANATPRNLACPAGFSGLGGESRFAR